MSACVFCALVARTAPVSVVAEDEHVLAAMTIRPQHAGHVLLFPRAHVEDFALLEGALRSHLFQVAARLKRAICEAVPCQGFQLLINDGEATGQRSDCRHLHVHLLPRSLRVPAPGEERAPEALRAELDALAAEIAGRLSSTPGAL